MNPSLLIGDSHCPQYPLPQRHVNGSPPGPWGQNEYYLNPQPQPLLNDALWIQKDHPFGGII